MLGGGTLGGGTLGGGILGGGTLRQMHRRMQVPWPWAGEIKLFHCVSYVFHCFVSYCFVQNAGANCFDMKRFI